MCAAWEIGSALQAQPGALARFRFDGSGVARGQPAGQGTAYYGDLSIGKRTLAGREDTTK
jgi:hypothetical protein